MKMKIDLHIHSKTCSDGKMALPNLLEEVRRRGVKLVSITDHDAVECQESAEALASRFGINYLSGLELNISFAHPGYRNAKPVSLDVLGYQYDYNNRPLLGKLAELREHRRVRAERILENINREFLKEGRTPFTSQDMDAIEQTVDGAFGRPHIAEYMVKKGIVADKQDAFDKYLVKCDVPKMPVSLEEASELVRGAGGKLMLAHPNDPNGTSLVSLTRSIQEQHTIIKEMMLPHIDGIECWHPRHDPPTTSAYLKMAQEEGLIVTGGSDCHQNPVLLGTLNIPPFVAEQFGYHNSGL
jgi:predicted metal-dependent phosphoesterase TrpH